MLSLSSLQVRLELPYHHQIPSQHGMHSSQIQILLVQLVAAQYLTQAAAEEVFQDLLTSHLTLQPGLSPPQKLTLEGIVTQCVLSAQMGKTLKVLTDGRYHK